MLFKPGAPTLFTPQRADEEAQRARKLEGIYHLGQRKAWDGRAVLQEALERFPRPAEQRLEERQRRALARVFSVLMWGELAAWRVAAQLADLLEEREARMAATAQAHDEARHYYVLHDYLQRLGVAVPPLDAHARRFLNACLGTPRVLEKLVGMQLFVETIALTIFQMVRRADVDPALTWILGYYEVDEARHVGLGVQLLPDLLRQASVPARAHLLLFQVRVLVSLLASFKSMEPELRVLGAEPRTLLEDGQARFARILAEYRREPGAPALAEGQVLARGYEAVQELVFPSLTTGSWAHRLGRAAGRLREHSALG